MYKKILVIFLSIVFSGCVQQSKDQETNIYNEQDFSVGGPEAPFYNERTQEFMQSDNPYAEIDSYKTKTSVEKELNNNRWHSSRMETRWQEYKGTMVRVQILLGNTDLNEMRLKHVKNTNGTDIDTDIKGVLSRVADYEMKRVCGRNVESIVMIYDRPSFDVMRPTPFFDYRIESDGTIMREYGFRCVYGNN